MSKRGSGGLVVYVTSHGFGHLHRTAAVLNQIPPDVPITVKSHADLFSGWRERLRRPVELVPYVSDVGAINPPGDSAAVDAAATIERAMIAHTDALRGLDLEADWLRDHGARAVLADAPAVPLAAARRAGAPAYLMTNFTWADIYASYARKIGPHAKRFVAELAQVYRQADCLLRVEPALRMAWLPRQETLGMVVNRGRDRGEELRRTLGLERGSRLVYVYLGRYGQTNLDWSRLERHAAQKIHFVSYHGAPGVAPANLHVVPSEGWPGGDLIASADAVLAKAGYGTVTEAMASGTPIIYPPRSDFAEYRVLDRALRAWGGGAALSSRDFRALKLDRALAKALGTKPGPPPFTADGAQQVAQRVLGVCR